MRLFLMVAVILDQSVTERKVPKFWIVHGVSFGHFPFEIDGAFCPSFGHFPFEIDGAFCFYL